MCLRIELQNTWNKIDQIKENHNWKIKIDFDREFSPFSETKKLDF